MFLCHFFRRNLRFKDKALRQQKDSFSKVYQKLRFSVNTPYPSPTPYTPYFNFHPKELLLQLNLTLMQILLAIFLGGGLGSVSRYALSRTVTSNFTNINPMGTLIANLASTIILALVLYLSAVRGGMSSTAKALLIVGFCGGFSTFSTFSYETFELLRNGNYTFAVANILLSLLLGLGVLFVLAKNI